MVIHINGNTMDNDIDNLRWSNFKERQNMEQVKNKIMKTNILKNIRTIY